METAPSGGGCFCHVEGALRRIAGIISTQAGYCGGNGEKPSCQDVCLQLTGHAEVVEVTFEPAVIS